MLDSITGWTFLDEPLYRWAIFIVAIILILWAWSGVLGVAKSVID